MFKFRLGITWIVVMFSLYLPNSVFAQNRTLTGKITDANTGEPLPYVTVFVKLANHANKGTASDFNGTYRLTVPSALLLDSVYVTYVSYIPARKPIDGSASIDFQLKADNRMLKDVLVTPKSYVNPAWEIMDQMVKHKSINNSARLKSYQFQSYNRIQVYMNNLSDKMKQRKAMRQLLPLMDSLKEIVGSNGTPILPIFMSETVSDIYNEHSPDKKTEHVVRTRVNGVGIEDATLISQIVSAGLQQYNFYQNYLRLAGKDFISPLSDSWKLFYDYELVDRNDHINGKDYYKIAYKPKRSHDLSFTGVFWLTHDSYALYRMDASLSPDANLDFIDKIRIQQEMIQPAGTQAWLPSLTRIVVNINNLLKNQAGFLGQFYIANKDFEINKTYPDKLFAEPLTISDDADKKDNSYWITHRPDTLTASDKRVYQMIDTVKNLPVVRTYADLVGMLINGYYKVGKFGFGPYVYTYSYNDLEGSVLRLGGMTNHFFSTKLILGGSLSYGFRDQKWLYDGFVNYIFSRKPWTEAGISYTRSLGQTAYQFENFSKANEVFKASIRNGDVTRRGPFLQNEAKIYLQTDLTRTLRGTFDVLTRTFDPLFKFNYTSPVSMSRYHDYQVTEAGLELQWTPGRRQLQSSKINRRVQIKDEQDDPVVTIRYKHGLKADGGDFTYDKIAANISQKIHMGIWGKGDYSLTGGWIPASLPLPLLENHRYNFNTMRFLEFTSDKYVSLNYTQHFEGLITNSIPLLRALNLRTVGDINILDGSLSESNNMPFVNGIRHFNRSLHGIPYVEAGYGVENIFKFLRFDFLYRLNHNDHLDQLGHLPNRFALRTSVQFRL